MKSRNDVSALRLSSILNTSTLCHSSKTQPSAMKKMFAPSSRSRWRGYVRCLQSATQTLYSNNAMQSSTTVSHADDNLRHADKPAMDE